MKALLIIDMQNVCFKPETPRYDTKGIVDRINKLAAIFRSENQLVIFIQHDGTKQNFCFPGAEEWKILENLIIKDFDIIVLKTVNDAFYKSELIEILNNNNIDEVVITGCATDYCVDATVKGALVHDYNITVISDGHTTANRNKFKAEEIIDYFNNLWSDFIPTKGKIQVKTFSEYANLIKSMTLK